MKKILVLGGAKAQVPLIEAAKKEGYYVVLCDWTTTNPGIALADKHYQVSTMDLDAVLEVARDEKVDGVVSNSEAVMINVATVSQELELVGNPSIAIETLQSKNKFRKFQEKIGIFSPVSIEADSFEELLEGINHLSFPIVLKPSKSSGSRGTTVVEKKDSLLIKTAYEECRKFSTNDKVTVEEYVVMPTLRNIEGDVFVHNGTILWNGMFSTFRSPDLPTLPQGDIFPIILSDEKLTEVKEEITLIFNKLGVIHGEFNIESYYNDKGKLFVIEINARQGGNAIPSLVEDHSGVDMYKLLVTTAMRDDYYFEQVCNSEAECNYITNYIVFSKKAGSYKGLEINDKVKKYVYDILENYELGQNVNKVQNASDSVGMVRLKFNTREEQLEITENIKNLIYPIVG